MPFTSSPRELGVHGPGYEEFPLYQVPWHRLLWADNLNRDTNIFQCAGNNRVHRMLQKEIPNEHAPKPGEWREATFNFAYGVNMLVVNSHWPSVHKADISRKISEIVAPSSDCVGFGDYSSVRTGPPGTIMIADPRRSFGAWSLIWQRIRDPTEFDSKYVFGLSRRHGGRVNIAFLGGHIEHRPLRDWTLPVAWVWDRWHHRNHWPAHRYYDGRHSADDWSIVYGEDELIQIIFP